METRQDYNHKNLEGVDADIETSLKEYGFAWIKTEKEILFYYGIVTDDIEYTAFDFCTFDLDLDIAAEFDWIKKEDWKSLLSFTGSTQSGFNATPLALKIRDLYSYFGYENIFGSSYWEGLTYDEVIKT